MARACLGEVGSCSTPRWQAVGGFAPLCWPRRGEVRWARAPPPLPKQKDVRHEVQGSTGSPG
eukprot:5986080-Pyramimonas_sp.AAC.1